MPGLFVQRQNAYDTEKMRVQAKDAAGLWVDIRGNFGFSGPSPTPVTWRTDGPDDDVQRFERGKPDQGEMTLDGRWVPFGRGGRLMSSLEDSGESTDFRLWFRGGPVFRNGSFAPLYSASIAAIAAGGDGLLTVDAGSATAAQLAAFRLQNIAGPNAGILLGVEDAVPPAKAGGVADLTGVLVLIAEQVESRLTCTVSLPTDLLAAPALADVPFSVVKLPFYREFNGFVQGRSATGSQEQPVDSQTTLKVNTKPNDYIDEDTVGAVTRFELKRLYGVPLAP